MVCGGLIGCGGWVGCGGLMLWGSDVVMSKRCDGKMVCYVGLMMCCDQIIGETG